MEKTEIAANNSRAMSVGDWMLVLFLTAIPLVGIIMLFVWAFSDGTDLSKANWAKATLIWIAIIITLYVLLFIAIFSTIPLTG